MPMTMSALGSRVRLIGQRACPMPLSLALSKQDCQLGHVGVWIATTDSKGRLFGQCDRGLPCAESERVRFQDIHLHITKTRCPEALWKCRWIHHHHCVEKVKQTK